jgi:hypothetical protein
MEDIAKAVRSRTHLSPWAKYWLLHPMISSTTLSAATRKLLLDIADTNDDSIRSRAVHVLARHGMIKGSDVVDEYERTSQREKPDLAFAVAHAKDASPEGIEAIRNDAPLMKWIVDHVQVRRVF